MVSSRIASFIIVALLTGLARLPAQVPDQLSDRQFGELVRQLSEPGGYFDTDNLISNEASYLDVVPALYRLGVAGGVYLGVGPAQNFSYIAHVRPEIALLIDLRRDNMLQHLWYKALFEMAPSRIEFLSLMYGRRTPGEPATWPGMSPEELVSTVSAAEPVADPEGLIAATVERSANQGVSLTDADRRAIADIHRRFVTAGPSLKFQTHGRAARACYPSHGDLIMARDITGRPASFLAQEASYSYLRLMQSRNLLVPVVGNLAGGEAMATVSDSVASWGATVSAFYTSNVELYLVQDGIYSAFADNLGRLPTDESSVIIRSVFDRPGFGNRSPMIGRAGCSDQKLSTIRGILAGLAEGRIGSYRELVDWAAVPLADR